DQPSSAAHFAWFAERFEESLADALARHLHQTQRRDLGDLVLGTVPPQALGQPAQYELPVALQHHVDEVDDDDAAQVTQPELAHDLLGRLQVVAGDRLLQVAAGTGVLAGVDVDDGHRLGTVDHEAAARGQEHLAVQRLEQLLVDAHVVEHVAGPGVPPKSRYQVGRDVVQVRLDHLVRARAVHHEFPEVLVEQVPDDADHQV